MGVSMSATEVKRIRDRLGLTQVELAERLGVTQTAISYWEDGKRTPRGPVVILLKNLLAEIRSQKKAVGALT